MSDSSQTVVRLDPMTAAEADALAASVVRWLVRSGIVGPVAVSSPAGGPAPAYRAGPEAFSVVVADEGRAPSWQYDDVEVTAERGAHHAAARWTPARCGRCATELPADVDLDLFAEWAEGPEPVATCAACGWSAPYGDWPCPWPSAVGAPAVTFLNWPVLSAAFLDELAQRLGSRTVVVRTHL